MGFRSVCALLFLFSFGFARLEGGSILTSSLQPNPFAQGEREFQAGAGAFFSIDSGGPSHPTVNYAMENVRLGFMLNDAHGSGFFAGNWEFMIEAFGGEVFAGPGTSLGGATLLLRYNFVQPHAFIVPYFQIGAGGAYSDIAEDDVQTLVGSRFEFNLQGSFGLRVPVNQRFSIYLEEGYRHISNAGLSRHNSGLNSFGGSAGLIFSF